MSPTLLYVSLQVQTARGATGTIEGSFGKSGKFKVSFPNGVALGDGPDANVITLRFKRFVYDKNAKTIKQ